MLSISTQRGTNYQRFLYRELEETILLFKSVTDTKLMELCHSANYLKGISLLNTEEGYLNRGVGGSKNIFGFDEYSINAANRAPISVDTDPMNTILTIIFNYLHNREAPGFHYNIKRLLLTYSNQLIIFTLPNFYQTSNYMTKQIMSQTSHLPTHSKLHLKNNGRPNDSYISIS